MTCDTLTRTLALICSVLLPSCGGEPPDDEAGGTETSGDGDGDGDPGDGDGEPGDGDGDDPECAAMDAASGPDPCVTPIGWAWDGATCVEILCSCEGADCGGLFETEDACQAAYVECFEGTVCNELGAQACMAHESCAALTASPVSSSNGSSCVAEPEFVGCDDIEDCDQALTWGCDAQDQSHLFPNGCMPDDFTPCDGPGNLPDCS